MEDFASFGGAAPRLLPSGEFCGVAPGCAVIAAIAAVTASGDTSEAALPEACGPLLLIMVIAPWMNTPPALSVMKLAPAFSVIMAPASMTTFMPALTYQFCEAASL